MRLKWLLPVLFLGACVMNAPDHVAGKFCRLSAEEDGHDQIKKILSRDVRDLWGQAQAASDAWGRENPGEKPPLGDGVPLQAFPDFAPICKVQNISGKGNERIVDVYHGFYNDPKAGWTDRLVLKPEMGSWVIGDIQFAPEYEGSLRSVLEEVLKDDVDKFIERREACEHFIGEEPYDDERRAFLNKSIQETCTGTNAELQALKDKYSDKPNILKKLMPFEEISGF